MNLAECHGQETVARHREKDARLSEDVDDECRDHAREDTNGDEVRKPRIADEPQTVRDGICTIEICVVDGCREDERDGGIEADADEDREHNANRQTLLRCLAFFRRGCYGVKSHKGEEYDGSSCHDPSGAKRQEGIQIIRNSMGGGDGDKSNDRAECNEDQRHVELCTFLCAVRQDQPQYERDDHGGEIDETALRHGCRQRFWDLHPERRHHA